MEFSFQVVKPKIKTIPSNVLHIWQSSENGAHDRNRTGGPLPYQGSALPTELRGRFALGLPFYLYSQQQVRLIHGAGDETRTRDIQLGRLKLYQLSYSRLNFTGLSSPTQNHIRRNKNHIHKKCYYRYAGSHVVAVDPVIDTEISYI